LNEKQRVGRFGQGYEKPLTIRGCVIWCKHPIIYCHSKKTFRITDFGRCTKLVHTYRHQFTLGLMTLPDFKSR